jgi:hypothetical protein
MTSYLITVDRPKKGAEDQTMYVVVLRKDGAAKAVRVAREPLTERKDKARHKEAIALGTAAIRADQKARMCVIRATITSLQEE